MGTELKKYVAIRYNVDNGYRPSQWGEEGRANLDPGWLAERLALFDRFCSYSLENQTHRDFTVLIAFDPATSGDYVQAVCARARGIDVKPVHVEADQHTNARFNEMVQGDTDADFVAVTRLDSDDALAPTFMGLVDTYARREIAGGRVDLQPLYIAFPHGQNFDTATNRYTRHDYVMSAFGTMVERPSPAMKGIYSRNHTKMADDFDTVVAGSHGAQWCIVVHDNNVANVVRGKPIAKPDFTVGRPGLETKADPERKERKPGQNSLQASGVAPRTMDNFLRFLSGRPIRLRKEN